MTILPIRSTARRLCRDRGTALVAVLLLLGLDLSPATAQTGGYQPLAPIESRSGAAGTTDSASIVTYNEYTGNVSIDLSVSVQGLTLPVRFNSIGSDVSSYYPTPDGSVGSFGYGFLGALTPEALDISNITSNTPPTNFQKVLVLEAGGVETEFVPDYFFQQAPAGDGWFNYHYIDRELRRLERTIDIPHPADHTAGNYVLLDRDGSRTRYEPRDTSGVFYPVEIVGANGRRISLGYRDTNGAFPSVSNLDEKSASTPDPVLASSPTTLLETINDEWGRSLRLHYALRPSGQRVVVRVSLDAPGEATRDLALFEYLEHNTGTQLLTRLHRKVTPEGHAVTFGYRDQTPGFGTLIERVTLPTGGAVELTYGMVEQPICPYQYFNNTTNVVEMEGEYLVRVSTLTFAGQRYIYSYETGQRVSDNHDGSWVVRRTSFGPSVADNHERLTQYHHENTNATTSTFHDCSPLAYPKRKAKLAGKPIRRLESLGGPEGSIIPTATGNFTFLPGGSHRRQEWAFTLVPLHRNGNVAPLRSDIFLKVPVELEYSEKKDGRVWLTRTDRGADNRYFTAPSFDLPTRVTHHRIDYPAHKQIRTYAYESRVAEGHGPTTSIADQPHVIGLMRLQERLREVVGELHTVRRTAQEYSAGRHPQVIERVVHTAPSAVEEEQLTYFAPGHDWHGLLRYRDRGSQDGFARRVRTAIEAYQFGQPSRVQPPAGPAIERVIRGDGLLVSELKDGVRVGLTYDDDGRQVRRHFPGSAQHDETTVLSAPDAPPTRTRRIGSRTLAVERFDPWGRLLSTELWQNETTSGLRTTRYDNLGRVASETNASGAQRSYTYDVLGRQRSIRTHLGDANGPLLESVDMQYQALAGGRSLTRTTLWRVDSTVPESTVQESEVDLFGRTIRAATIKDGETHQTTVRFRFVDGRERVLIQPEGGTELALEHAPRLREVDWLGRTTLECHPEHGCTIDEATFRPVDLTRAIVYQHDELGRVFESRGPGQEQSRFAYDGLGRLVSRFDNEPGGGSDLIMTARFAYDPTNNQLTTSESFVGGSAVTQGLRVFDALQRPRESALVVPPAAAAPFELSPIRYWLFGDQLPLRFEEAAPVDRYVVELQRLGGTLPPGVDAAPILAFETLETEIALTEPLIRAAVAALGTHPAATVYLSDLDADPDFLLDPAEDKRYRWRVYGWNDDEPTLAAPWTPLDRPIGPDDCYFRHFRVRDGVSEGALVEWETANCPETGPFSLRILTSVEHPVAACSLEDALFAADKNGPKRALFMVTGWDMVDGAPAFPANANAPQCAPVELASFRGVLEDADGFEMHAVGPVTGRVVPGGACDVRNVNVIDGLNGTAPIIRWETQDCESHTVQVIATAEVAASHPDAAACREVGVIAQGAAGQTEARFMVDGYTGIGGVACGAVSRAWFRVRLIGPSGDVFETTPELGFVEPVGGLAGCYTRLFTEASAPGLVPVIAWETRGCEGLDAELTRTSVGVPQDLRCVVRDELWQTVGFGARDARFMVDGYAGDEGVWCDPLADMLASGGDRVEFDFTLNLRDPLTGAFAEPQERIKETLRATYTQPPAGSPTGPCRIDYFVPTNGLHGRAPVAAWGTSGDCQEVRLRVWTDDAVEPAACRLAGVVWSQQLDGPESLAFMVNGYDVGLQENYDGVTDCRGRPGGNGTYGEALRFAYLALEAEGPTGTARWPETDTEVVLNHNDQIHPDLPAPGEPCSILDFFVNQPAPMGIEPTASLPVVYWTTNCPAQGRYSVQVLAATEAIDHHPFCNIEDMFFSADKNGPKPARFLRTGWWDYVNGQHLCLGRQATFRMQIVDTETGLVVPGETRDPVATFYSGEISGQPPIPPCAGDSCTATTCSDPVPTFAGLSMPPTAGPNCQAQLTWSPGQSHCGNPVTYRVYRGSHPSTTANEAFRIADGIVGTSFTDASIVAGGSYYYVVTAHDAGTLVESQPIAALRLTNGCSSSGGPDPLRVEPSTLSVGQTATLAWDFPAAAGVFLVGFGNQPLSGSLQVSPLATTTYQAFVGMPDGTIVSFSASITVEGDPGPPPVAGGACDRPCSDSVNIDGEEYFCRGFGAWDGSYQVEQSPVWLTVDGWRDYVLDGLGNPISPYCLKAVCGSGPLPPNPWHEPHDEPYIWDSDEQLLLEPELAGDGWDNDCDTLIDEIGN